MRSIPIPALFILISVLPAMAQEGTAPPRPAPPTVTSSDSCIFNSQADANQVAAAKTVTIVKCKLTAPMIPDASVNSALRQNNATKGVTRLLGPSNILATTANGNNVTIYVKDNDSD